MIKLRSLIDENYMAFSAQDKKNVDEITDIILSYVASASKLLKSYIRTVNTHDSANAITLKLIHLLSKDFSGINWELDRIFKSANLHWTTENLKPPRLNINFNVYMDKRMPKYSKVKRMVGDGDSTFEDVMRELAGMKTVTVDGGMYGDAAISVNTRIQSSAILEIGLDVTVDVLPLLHAAALGVNLPESAPTKSRLRSVVAHEYTHVLQIVHADSQAYTDKYQLYGANHKSTIDDSFYALLYFGSPIEIQAFVRQSAMELRGAHPRKSAMEILKLVQSGQVRVSRKMPAVNFYLGFLKKKNTFPKAHVDKILKRYYKTLYQLLTTEET